ncbi:MAG: hypothetical protein US34_C0031G0002 [Candidatus Nomurabacteria bacterium GW2011_GWC2_36_9]|nr:MAG: hypothetical protein US34_C0031G0002 [Candidatus Nomurabacteria bacterium GW2011_GWC2_36_9]
MEKPNNSGAEPNTPSFDDAVGKEQPVNSIPSGTSNEEQPDKKSDANGEKPEDQSGVKPNDKSESTEDKDKKSEGDKTFWGKFKSEDDAKRSYDEAQTKIIDQGKEINDLKTSTEKNQQFLSILDKALTKNPQLAEQLKASLAEAMKASDAEPEDEPDIDTLLDKKLEERETKAKTKTEIDKWISEHEDFKTPRERKASVQCPNASTGLRLRNQGFADKESGRRSSQERGSQKSRKRECVRCRWWPTGQQRQNR